jgi:hypothetical protein
VSFRAHARTVQDPTVSLARRRVALRRCVARYAPYGFDETRRYLEERFGTFDEPATLKAAVAELAHSREVWLTEVADFGRRRRAAKAQGRRRASRADVAAYSEQRWPGDTAPDARTRRPVTEGFLARYGMILWEPQPVNHRRRVRRLPKVPPQRAPVGALGCGVTILALIVVVGLVFVHPPALAWWVLLLAGPLALTVVALVAASGDRAYREILRQDQARVREAAEAAEQRWLASRGDTGPPE